MKKMLQNGFYIGPSDGSDHGLRPRVFWEDRDRPKTDPQRPKDRRAFTVLKLADFWLIFRPNLGILLELFITKGLVMGMMTPQSTAKKTK